jgi:ketosteroid isomerase-like protein
VIPRERVHAEFINNIREGIDETREGWMADIAGDRLGSLMEHYASDAMLIPPRGEPLYGRAAIRDYWEENLPHLGQVQTGLGDLDASGQMAMIGGTYSIEKVLENGAIVRESGGLLTVFVQTGRRWFIRAQVFANPTSG